MKQAIRTVLPVQIGINLDDVEKIEFRFEQRGGKRLDFIYPSENATRDGNTVNLDWSMDDTNYFEAEEITLDTRIKLKNSVHNPATEMVKFRMNPSLFREVESND